MLIVMHWWIAPILTSLRDECIKAWYAHENLWIRIVWRCSDGVNRYNQGYIKFRDLGCLISPLYTCGEFVGQHYLMAQPQCSHWKSFAKRCYNSGSLRKGAYFECKWIIIHVLIYVHKDSLSTFLSRTFVFAHSQRVDFQLRFWDGTVKASGVSRSRHKWSHSRSREHKLRLYKCQMPGAEGESRLEQCSFKQAQGGGRGRVSIASYYSKKTGCSIWARLFAYTKFDQSVRNSGLWNCRKGQGSIGWTKQQHVCSAYWGRWNFNLSRCNVLINRTSCTTLSIYGG